MDLTSARFEGSCRILEINDQGEPVAVETKDKVIPCNLLPGSLFNQTDVSFNGLMVSYVSSPLGNPKKILFFPTLFILLPFLSSSLQELLGENSV